LQTRANNVTGLERDDSRPGRAATAAGCRCGKNALNTTRQSIRDPDVGQFSFADPLFSSLNEAESMAGATVRARFADPFLVFDPQGNEAAETTAICTLTLVCTQHDSHPSDAGYRALAGLVWNASGCGRLR
jgi:hypothetical protein